MTSSMLNTFGLSCGKWLQTIKISITKHTAYRLDFFLQIIAPTFIFFFVNYSLWTKIYGVNSQKTIQGYSYDKMVSYHVWVLIVTLIAKGYTSFNLSNDIRLGKISNYLIYPFNFWEFHTASFIGFEIIQLAIGTITIAALQFFNIIEIINYIPILYGVLICIIVSFFWFSLQFMIGMLAFWLDQTWMLRVTVGIVSNFLSGMIIPLELYPETFFKILKYTPFPYLTFYPVKVFMGIETDIASVICILLIWTFAINIINVFIWKKGLKLYTAAGM